MTALAIEAVRRKHGNAVVPAPPKARPQSNAPIPTLKKGNAVARIHFLDIIG
jgi:hypothetical protein